MKQSRHSVPTVFAALGQTSLAAARSLALPAARTAALPLLLPLALIALPAALPSVLHAQQTGFTWTQVASPVPQSRSSLAMAYDSGRNRTVVFGGINVGGSRIGDTWEWNGATDAYTQVASTGPQSRAEHAMAYDSGRNRTVLFGGDNGSIRLGDTWEWNGANAAWTQVAATGPQSRFGHAMAYDSGRNRTVLFGGTTDGGSFSFFGDTWEWNGATAAWTLVASTGPQSRSAHAMAYDSGRNRTVVFGGFGGSSVFGDTWEGGVNASASAYGTGCGSPALTISPGALPRINTIAQALLTNIPSSLAFVCLGWSNTTTGIFALPLSLAPFGLPGCLLQQSLEVSSLPVTSTGVGTATFSVPLPNNTGLLGLRVYLQGWAIAPGYNPGNLILSNGLEWLIGS